MHNGGMNKRLVYILFVVFVVFAFAKPVLSAAEAAYPAQCAMCRAVLESEADNSTAKGINNGIKYLMVIPYILVGGVFYFVWKSKRKDSAKE